MSLAEEAAEGRGQCKGYHVLPLQLVHDVISDSPTHSQGKQQRGETLGAAFHVSGIPVLAGCSLGTFTTTKSPASHRHVGLGGGPAGPQPACTEYQRWGLPAGLLQTIAYLRLPLSLRPTQHRGATGVSSFRPCLRRRLLPVSTKSWRTECREVGGSWGEDWETASWGL